MSSRWHTGHDRKARTVTVCGTTHPFINELERLYIDFWATNLSFDPAGSTVALWIGASSFPMTWTGVAVQGSDGSWSQHAVTVKTFIGSAVVGGPFDVALTPGRYIGVPVITAVGGQIIQVPATPIDIR